MASGGQNPTLRAVSPTSEVVELQAVPFCCCWDEEGECFPWDHDKGLRPKPVRIPTSGSEPRLAGEGASALPSWGGPFEPAARARGSPCERGGERASPQRRSGPSQPASGRPGPARLSLALLRAAGAGPRDTCPCLHFWPVFLPAQWPAGAARSAGGESLLQGWGAGSRAAGLSAASGIQPAQRIWG